MAQHTAFTCASAKPPTDQPLSLQMSTVVALPLLIPLSVKRPILGIDHSLEQVVYSSYHNEKLMARLAMLSQKECGAFPHPTRQGACCCN